MLKIWGEWWKEVILLILFTECKNEFVYNLRIHSNLKIPTFDLQNTFPFYNFFLMLAPITYRPVTPYEQRLKESLASAPYILQSKLLHRSQCLTPLSSKAYSDCWSGLLRKFAGNFLHPFLSKPQPFVSAKIWIFQILVGLFCESICQQQSDIQI